MNSLRDALALPDVPPEPPPAPVKPERLALVPFEKKHEAQVLALAREMHDESVFHRHIAIDEKKLLVQLHAARSLEHVYFKLAVRGDIVVGGFFGTISTVYFSQERVAKDLAWFVTKTKRGSFAAVLLVADFERWGREKGVKHFVLGQSTGVNQATTRALYEHLGYEVIGFNTMKRIA